MIAGRLRSIGAVAAASLTIGAVSEVWHSLSDSCIWIDPKGLPGPCIHRGLFSLGDFSTLTLISLAAMSLLTALSGFSGRWERRVHVLGHGTKRPAWMSDDERRLAFCLIAAGASLLGSVATLALRPALSSVEVLGPWWGIPALFIMTSLPMISVFAFLFSLERFTRVRSYYTIASVGAFVGALWGILSRPEALVATLPVAIVILPFAFSYSFCLVRRLLDRSAPLSLDGIVWFSGVSTALFFLLMNFREFIIPLASLYATTLLLIMLRSPLGRKLGPTLAPR